MLLQRFLNHINTKLNPSLTKNSVTVNDTSTSIPTKTWNFKRVQIVIYIFFIIFCLVGFFSKIDIIVSARGEVLQELGVEKIQHVEGGMIESVLVKEGDYVYKGQPVVKIKAIDRTSELGALESEVVAAHLEIERLKSLVEGRDPNFISYANYQNLVQLNKQTWLEEKNKNNSNEAMLQHDIDHKKDLVKSMNVRRESTSNQMSIISEQLNIKEDLYKENVVSYMEVLNMRVQKMNMLRELQNIEENILNEKYAIQKLEKEILDMRNIRNSDYMKRLSDLEKNITVQKEHLPSAKDKVERLIVYSPVDGVVDKIHYNYQSAVVPPGESIADITPLGTSLIGEVKLPKKDIGFIEIGQPVKVKIDTYRFTEYGSLEGQIQSLSRTSYKENEELFYIAKVSLKNSFLTKNKQKFYVTPHMEFTADIKTGNRRLIDYIIKPIVMGIEGAIDER